MSLNSTTLYDVHDDDNDNDNASDVSEPVAPRPDILMENMNRMITELCGSIGTVIQAQASSTQNMTTMQSNVSGLQNTVQSLVSQMQVSPTSNPVYSNMHETTSVSVCLAQKPLSSSSRSIVRMAPEIDTEGASDLEAK